MTRKSQREADKFRRMDRLNRANIEGWIRMTEYCFRKEFHTEVGEAANIDWYPSTGKYVVNGGPYANDVYQNVRRLPPYLKQIAHGDDLPYRKPSQ